MACQDCVGACPADRKRGAIEVSGSHRQGFVARAVVHREVDADCRDADAGHRIKAGQGALVLLVGVRHVSRGHAFEVGIQDRDAAETRVVRVRTFKFLGERT